MPTLLYLFFPSDFFRQTVSHPTKGNHTRALNQEAQTNVLCFVQQGTSDKWVPGERNPTLKANLKNVIHRGI
jgi:hypothetical protein